MNHISFGVDTDITYALTLAKGLELHYVKVIQVNFLDFADATRWRNTSRELELWVRWMVSCSFMRRTRPSLSLYWLNAEWCWIFSQGLEVSFSYEMLWCEHVKRPQRVVNICRISRQPEKTEPTLGGQTSRAVFLETSQTSQDSTCSGGGGLQTLDHLPISRCQLWNFQDGLTGPSTLRSLNIIRKWLGILGAFWSLGGCQPVTIKYI